MPKEEHRRFGDALGLDDPMVVLGQLHVRMDYHENQARTTINLLEQVARDVSEIKLQRATEAGQTKGVINVFRVAEILAAILASAGTAWATVKTLAHGS